MKNLTLSILAALFVSWNPGTIWAQGEETSAGAESKREKIRQHLRTAARPVDPNDPRVRGEAERMRRREKERQWARREREKRRQKMMEMQKKNLEQFEKTISAARVDQPGGKVRDYQQQLKELQQQLSHEEQKHLERVAKMQRILELATKKDAKETLTRVEKLMQREQMRYDRKRQRTQMRINMIQRWEARKSEPRAPDDARLREETRKAMERYKDMPKRKAEPAGKKETGEKPQQ